MKKNSIAFLLIFWSFLANSQQMTDFEWTKIYGGSYSECYGVPQHDNSSIILSEDEKFIYVATTSSSNDGFVRDSLGMLDGWILKLDSQTGDTLKTYVFGGSKYDVISDICNANDGGIVICGHSNSQDGDFEKTNLHINLGMPDYDYSDGFIAKFSADLVLLWVKYYGGQPFVEETSVGTDKLYSIIQTKDGGYMAAGSTYSNTDDIPTDWDRYLGGWLLKIDKDGIIEYTDKFVGVNHNENNPNDLVDVVELEEDLFAAIGTQTYFIDNSDGTWDWKDFIWVIKTEGKKILAEAEFGNTSSNYGISICKSEIGLNATSYIRPISGDVSQGYGLTDILLMQLSENIELKDKKFFGGSSEDFPYGTIMDNFGHYIVYGQTISSDYDAEGDGYG